MVMIARNKKSEVNSSEDERLKALFEKYFDRLAYVAFKLLKDQDAANDMAQEAFIKYWQLRDTIDTNEIAIKNFLYSTVKNGSLNILRHERVVSEHALQIDDQALVEQAVLDSIISAEVLDSIRNAINSLPQGYQKIAQLAYLEGKKNQEIADELEMSVNTVKKQKQKILELLRLRLTPQLMLIMLCLTA